MHGGGTRGGTRAGTVLVLVLVLVLELPRPTILCKYQLGARCGIDRGVECS